jgi:hypothetical protein
MPLLRVWLEGVDHPEIDPLLMHLRITEDGHPFRDEAVLGICGDLESEDDRYPFALLPDCTLDFGTYVTNKKKRFWRFQWGEQIEIGKEAVVIDNRLTYAYRITRMERL